MSNQKWSVDRQYYVYYKIMKNEEKIKRVSKYKLRRAIFEEFNKLCVTPNTKISEGRNFQIIQN